MPRESSVKPMHIRCDSHVHIVGPADIYPQSPTSTYLAQAAPLDELLTLAVCRGIERFVIVQPSFYGTDNAVLLEALDALGGRGRGVAVVDHEAIAKATLATYAARGVCGLRLNLYSPMGNVDRARMAATFAATAALAVRQSWHVEVIAPIEVLVEEETLAHAAVPVVIDHYGLFGLHAPASAAGRQLLGLLRYRHVWIKLSAPYRVSEDPLDTRPNRPWLAAILDAAKERCVWGSDWPHTPAHDVHRGGAVATHHRPISYEKLVDDFIAALGSAELTDMIMAGNPARLYGF
jgi:predicted TIM-barrel fold metal-dependent hydrolase